MAMEKYIIELGMLEQEATKFQQQMELVDQQILELQNLYNGLEELDKSKEMELLANLGKNIFIKTEVQSKELLVDVGNKTFVKKNIPETLRVIAEQLEKLMEAKNMIILKLSMMLLRVLLTLLLGLWVLVLFVYTIIGLPLVLLTLSAICCYTLELKLKSWDTK